MDFEVTNNAPKITKEMRHILESEIESLLVQSATMMRDENIKGVRETHTNANGEAFPENSEATKRKKKHGHQLIHTKKLARPSSYDITYDSSDKSASVRPVASYKGGKTLAKVIEYVREKNYDYWHKPTTASFRGRAKKLYLGFARKVTKRLNQIRV